MTSMEKTHKSAPISYESTISFKEVKFYEMIKYDICIF
jgi:hypothetical protein